MTTPAIWFCTEQAAPITLRIAAGSRDADDLAALETIRADHQPLIDALWHSNCPQWFAAMMGRASVSVERLVDIFDGYRQTDTGIWEDNATQFDSEAVAAAEWFTAAIENADQRADRMACYAERVEYRATWELAA